MRVKIVDRVNPMRVLGTIPTPTCPPLRTVSMAVFEGHRDVMDFLGVNTPTSTDSVRVIDFRVETIRSNSGWNEEHVLATDEPLDVLSTMRGFLAPTKRDRLR